MKRCSPDGQISILPRGPPAYKGNQRKILACILAFSDPPTD